jgi:hypothetical protein
MREKRFFNVQCHASSVYTSVAADVPTRTNSVASETDGSSPHSREPANGPYPEPDDSTPHSPANLPEVHFDPILPSTPSS